MKILVAEDDEVVLETIQIKLRNEGFATKGITNAGEIMDCYESFLPDLIITDILMPHTSGLDLIGIIRSRPGKKIPIIVLSGLGQEQVVMDAFQLGADDFITKPFNPTELIIRVKKLLKGK